MRQATLKIKDIIILPAFEDALPRDLSSFSLLKSCIQETGNEIEPVTVWHQKGTGMVLLNGHNRLKVYRDNNIEEIPVNVVDFETTEEALKYVLFAQLGSRNLNKFQRPLGSAECKNPLLQQFRKLMQD